MKEIQLTKGFVTIVDDEDCDNVSQYKWYICAQGYAVRTKHITGKAITIRLHRVIMNPPINMTIDHINGNKLDNRRSNLRVCTASDNAKNCRKKLNTTSVYKGVTWIKRDSKWRARIRVNYKTIHLGIFVNELDAAKAYNVAAILHHKEYAHLNDVG